MQASLLISSSIISLHPKDDGNRALELMDLYKINHLAVVKDNFYLGVISEREINNWDSNDNFIEEHLSKFASPHVNQDQHLFDIIAVLEKNSLSAVPVLDEKNQYLGVITNRKLLYTIAKSSAIQSPGGVIVLEMNHNDYSMTEIANIIESNDTKILSSYITSLSESTKIELTLKLNKSDVNSVIKGLTRYEYKIIAAYKEQDTNMDFKERYDHLMRFLNP